jgi:glycosyltransferase involved in cell wall biosynthesis
MRVLHLLKTAVGATWALRQMRELVRLGVEVHVALPDGPLIPQYEAAGVRVHIAQFDFPLRQPHRFPALRARLRGLVRDVQPDILHSHFVGTTLTMRLALGGGHPIPRIFQVPGPLHLEHPFFRRMEIASAGAADSWIGSCQWTCDRYRASGIAPERIFLSFYGTDVETFTPRPPGKLRGELALDPDAQIVGMVAFMYAPKCYLGQTRGLKGHEDLIDALALAARRHPSVVGVFAGGAWGGATAYEAQVRAYGREKLGDRALFLGTRSDVADLYADFDLAVHPSHSENLGGAGESLLMGVPTITTDVGGFPDLIKPGVTGWLVPPCDPIALAETIAAALSDPAEARKLAAQGEASVRQSLDVRHTARQVYDVYRTILKRKHNVV